MLPQKSYNSPLEITWGSPTVISGEVSGPVIWNFSRFHQGSSPCASEWVQSVPTKIHKIRWNSRDSLVLAIHNKRRNSIVKGWNSQYAGKQRWTWWAQKRMIPTAVVAVAAVGCSCCWCSIPFVVLQLLGHGTPSPAIRIPAGLIALAFASLSSGKLISNHPNAHLSTMGLNVASITKLSGNPLSVSKYMPEL